MQKNAYPEDAKSRVLATSSMAWNQIQKKIAAISNMRPPENEWVLQTVLRMTNYLAKLIPHLTDVLSHRRELGKEISDFTRKLNIIKLLNKKKKHISVAEKKEEK